MKPMDLIEIFMGVTLILMLIIAVFMVMTLMNSDINKPLHQTGNSKSTMSLPPYLDTYHTDVLAPKE